MGLLRTRICTNVFVSRLLFVAQKRRASVSRVTCPSYAILSFVVLGLFFLIVIAFLCNPGKPEGCAFCHTQSPG